MTEKYDLHMHSVYSDGSLTPEELLSQAKEKGLTGIAITDHDTIDAFIKDDNLPEIALDKEIICIPGVEFSAHHEGVSVHILGYVYDLDCPEILELCKNHRERRKSRNLDILKALQKHNMSITPEELYGPENKERVVGRPHIAKLLVEKGYVHSVQQAFFLWLGDKKPGYVKGPVYTIQETIEAIHAGHGKAVLAHPTLMKNDAFVRKILPMGFDGIECFYSKIPHYRVMNMVQLAEEHDLIMTGGSDFHGDIKPKIAIGESYTDAENFAKIIH